MKQSETVRWLVSKVGSPHEFFCGEDVSTDPNPESLTARVYPIWGLMRDAKGFHHYDDAQAVAEGYGGEVVQNPHH